LGLIIVLLLPVGVSEDPASIAMYGTGTIEQYDSNGNQIFTQTVHNTLTAQGGEFLIDNVFFDFDNGETDDDFQVGAICITDNDNFGFDQTAQGFDNDNGFSSSLSRCLSEDFGATGEAITPEALAVGVLPKAFAGGGVETPEITIGPFTFTAGENLPAGGTIEGMGICQANGSTGSFSDCQAGDGGSEGILFSTIDFGDVTLGDGDTVDLSYTFEVPDAFGD